jgi:probable F420-dependent oxidoreductase
MEFGLSIFQTPDTIQPADLGRLAEDRGFESLFFVEHTHIPASRETPYPVGGELPPEYSRLYDPFVALAIVAGATETLKLGTGICLVVERDPIVLAKEVASLDRLSGGRLLFGVGGGWNLEEMRNHGTDPSTRFRLLREKVEAMKAIWTGDEAEYHGRHVDFDPIWSWPKPLQEPHPPILVGGNGRGVLDRVLSYGDEWLPNRVGDEEKLIARIGKLRRRAQEEQGRHIPVTLYFGTTKPDRIRRYEEAGVSRMVFPLFQEAPEEVERRVDKYAAVVSEYNGGS